MSEWTAIRFLRFVVATLLVVHGAARVYYSIVDDFGVFLTMYGLPFGEVIAWGITLIEILGGTLLAFGFFVVPLTAYFAVQLIVGIFLVHAREGWFVVGVGRNGVEYSVLLIAALAAIGATHFYRARNARLTEEAKYVSDVI